MQRIRHPSKGHEAFLHETPPEAVHALLAVEELPHLIWEPAAGRGAIVNVLRGAGHAVIATDLIDYGVLGQTPARDFLKMKQPPNIFCKCILSNPPFNLAADFVRIGLKLCPKVILLLRLVFLESVGRSDILDDGTLARVHVFKNRLPLMHRDNYDGPKSTSTVAYAWFVWDRNHKGFPTIHRLSWIKSHDHLTTQQTGT